MSHYPPSETIKKQFLKTFKNVEDKFMEHPSSVNQTYFEHMIDAMSYSCSSLVSASVFAIHGVFPFLFEDQGSRMVGDLNKKLVEKHKLLEKHK